MAEETKQPSLEENFARLEELMGELEREDIPLEEAFSAYSAGMAVLKQCNDLRRQLFLVYSHSSLSLPSVFTSDSSGAFITRSLVIILSSTCSTTRRTPS